MWCSVASDASHHHPRMAGEAAGVDVEAAPEPDLGPCQQMGLREQPLEVGVPLCRAGCSFDSSSFLPSFFLQKNGCCFGNLKFHVAFC